MLRFLWFLVPASERCRRLGHRPRGLNGAAIMKPRLAAKLRKLSPWDAPAVAYHGEIRAWFCRRCHAQVGEPMVLEVSRSIQSLSMSGAEWKTLDERGYIWSGNPTKSRV